MYKKFITLLLLLANVFFANAAFTPKLEKQTNESTAKEKELLVSEKTATMSVADYEAMTGKKMNFFQRLMFKPVVRKMSRHMQKGPFNKEELTEGFNLGAFLLGFFTLGIGAIIDDLFGKDANFARWCRWGFLAFFIPFTIILYSSGLK